MYEEYAWFVFYNFATFVLALVLWEFIPRPAPEDYSTIPGLKSEDKTGGNVKEITEAGKFLNFLRRMHQDYGALSSFYWGPQYVVVIASKGLAEMLERYSAFKLPSEPFCAKSLSYQSTAAGQLEYCLPDSATLKARYEEATDILNKQLAGGGTVPVDLAIAQFVLVILLSPRRFAETANVRTFLRLVYDACDCEETALLQCGQLDENRTKFTEQCAAKIKIELEKVLPENSDQNAGKRVNLVSTFCAVCRCLSSLSEVVVSDPSVHVAVENVFKKSKSNAEIHHWDDDSERVNIMAETIRFSVPTPLHVRHYSKELDLNGHPVPALTPILILTDALLYDESQWPIVKAARFAPTRFPHRASAIETLNSAFDIFDAGSADQQLIAVRDMVSFALDGFIELLVKLGAEARIIASKDGPGNRTTLEFVRKEKNRNF